MKILFVFFIALPLFASLLLAEDVNIKVDVSKDLGLVPEIFDSNIWIQNLGNQGGSYIISKFLKENKPSVIQLSLPILLNTKSFEDFKTSLKEYLTMPTSINFFKEVKENNILVIVGFDPCPMPKWLSSRPGDNRPASGIGFTIQSSSPPKDYKLWGKVVEYTLMYLKHELEIKNLGFYVGHEQERDWTGDEQSFFKYYQYAAMAAKKVNESINIGGIGVGSWKGKKYECDSYPSGSQKICIDEGGWANANKAPFLKNFIEYAASNHVPIDFINWHSFGETPQKFPEIAETIRTWLRDYGFDDKKVKLYPSDWTYWEGRYPADYLDTQEIAAYIPQAIYYMWKAGIQWHGHDFDVVDCGGTGGYAGGEARNKETRKGSTFIGDWSLLTWGGGIGGGIAKPMYNALKAINMATHGDESESCKLLETKFTEAENVVAFSTISGNGRKISLIVSNFFPTELEKLKKDFFYLAPMQINFLDEEIKLIKKCMEESKVDSKNKLDTFLQCKDTLLSTLKDPKKIEAIDFTTKIYLCLNNNNVQDCILKASKDLKHPETKKIANTISNILNDCKKPKQAQIHFTNIPFTGKASLSTYTIDSIHSNACILNKNTEPIKTNTSCGIGGVIDQAVWESKEKAEKEGIEATQEYLFSSGYTNNAVELLKNKIKQCKNRKTMKECLNDLIPEISTKFNYTSEKVKKDLLAAFNRYKKTYHTSYYNSIETINTWEKTSLEGSKKTEEINISDNHYTLNITMEPNSICLVVLTQKRR